GAGWGRRAGFGSGVQIVHRCRNDVGGERTFVRGGRAECVRVCNYRGMRMSRIPWALAGSTLLLGACGTDPPAEAKDAGFSVPHWDAATTPPWDAGGSGGDDDASLPGDDGGAPIEDSGHD